jgi:hypothetical protein
MQLKAVYAPMSAPDARPCVSKVWKFTGSYAGAQSGPTLFGKAVGSTALEVQSRKKYPARLYIPSERYWSNIWSYEAQFVDGRLRIMRFESSVWYGLGDAVESASTSRILLETTMTSASSTEAASLPLDSGT